MDLSQLHRKKRKIVFFFIVVYFISYFAVIKIFKIKIVEISMKFYKPNSRKNVKHQQSCFYFVFFSIAGKNCEQIQLFRQFKVIRRNSHKMDRWKKAMTNKFKWFQTSSRSFCKS